MVMQTDIVVVGAGPAGLMASTVAASAGAGVLLMDERSWAGGRLGLQTQQLQGPDSMYRGRTGVDFCRGLLDAATPAGVKLVLDSAVSRIRSVRSKTPSLSFDVTPTKGEDYQVASRAVIIASGSLEPRPVFPGSTLAGVMLSGDAQVMLAVDGVLPGNRVLMVGSDNAPLLIAANLRAAGAHIVAVVDESPRILGRELNVAPLRDAGVDLLLSTRLVAVQGTRAVESATVAQTDSTGALVPGTERSFDVDAVCLAPARTSEASLAASAGCVLHEDAMEIMGGRAPVHSRRMATTVLNVYVCGDSAGVESGAVALESGRLAGLSAAADLGFVHPRTASLESLARGRLGYLRRGRVGLLRRRAKTALASEFRRIARARQVGRR